MKNFETILSDAGLELTDEQRNSIVKEMGENYKPISDWQKQHDKVQTLEKTLKDTQDKLKVFDGVDADALNKQIADLKEDLAKKDTEYQAQMADRDFQDMLKDSISAAKGKNAKAITALLDVDTLKASKNQKEDVASALKALSEAEDSKMLFGDAEPNGTGTGNPIGDVGGTHMTAEQKLEADVLAAMGLSPEKGDK